jgi:hypothetical protein
MNQLLLCSRPMSADDLCKNTSIDRKHLYASGCTQPAVIPAPSIIQAYSPYLLGNPNSAAHGVLRQLAPVRQSRELTHIALSVGDDNTVALADIIERLRTDGTSWLNSSVGIYAKRMDSFSKAAHNYQFALMKFRDVASATTPKATRMIAKQQAQAAYNAFQREFHREIGLVTKKIRTRRGTPINNVHRAINIANSSRSIAKLHVADQMQAHNLVRFSKYAKYLGTGMALIDFGTRAGNIQSTYREGGNWQRELFIESSSFAATGLLGVGAGMAINLFLFATPFGWAGLIIGGIMLAGIATAASINIDKLIHNRGGQAYDWLIEGMRI